MEMEAKLTVAASAGVETRSEVWSKSVYRVCKRVTDFILALRGLIILSPVSLIVAILIKSDDPKRTVFFGRERVGKDGEMFLMHKFSSMYVDAEEWLAQLLQYNEASGAIFKVKEDPRVTEIGACIRKYSIDELPQIFNVLRGDISLIGPRRLTFERMVAFDLDYIAKQSYWLDVKILFQTVKVVCKGDGAY